MIKAHETVTIMAPDSVTIMLKLLLKVEVTPINFDVTRQAKEHFTAYMDDIRPAAFFLHTLLATDEQTLSIGAMTMVVIQAVALFRVFWVMYLSMAMGLTMIVDFGRNNTTINLKTIKMNVIAVQGLL